MNEEQINQNMIQEDSENQKNTDSEFLFQKDSYFKYAFLAVLSLIYLPFALKSITVILTQKPINNFLDITYEIAGILPAVVFGYTATKKLPWKDKKSHEKSALYLFSSCLFLNLYMNKLSNILVGRMVNKMYLYWILMILAFLFVAILLTMAIPVKGTFVKNFGLSILFLFSYEVVVTGLDILLQIIPISFATTSVVAILISLTVSTLLVIGIEKNQAKEVSTPSFLSLVFPTIISLGSLITTVFLSLPTAPETAIANNLYASMEIATMQLMSGNTDLAFKSFKNGADRRNEWYDLLEENEFKTARLQYSDFTQIRYLIQEKYMDVDAIKEDLVNGNYNLDVGKEYLKMVSKNKDSNVTQEDSVEKELKIKIINDMIKENSFVSDVFSYQDIIDHKEQILERLDSFSDLDKFKNILEIVKKEEDGTMNMKDALDLLQIAKEYEDDLYVQYIAASYGSNFPHDAGITYSDIVECIYRYKVLYEERYGKNKEVTHDLLRMLYNINEYQEIINIIECEVNNGNSLDNIEMQYEGFCYLNMSDYDKCKEIANAMLKENENDYNALYFLSFIGYMKDDDYVSSIEYACRLAEQVDSLSGIEKNIADSELYRLIQNYTVFDNVNYHPVKELTKEELDALKNSNVVNDYYYASIYCYTEPDVDLALRYIHRLKDAGYLTAGVCYLEGNIYMQGEDFEEAVLAYKESLDLMDSPTTWYALANAYDALGDYDNAYLATLKVAEVCKDTDHDYDKYGIAIHNKNLLESLQSKVGEE